MLVRKTLVHWFAILWSPGMAKVSAIFWCQKLKAFVLGLSSHSRQHSGVWRDWRIWSKLSVRCQKGNWTLRVESDLTEKKLLRGNTLPPYLFRILAVCVKLKISLTKGHIKSVIYLLFARSSREWSVKCIEGP